MYLFLFGSIILIPFKWFININRKKQKKKLKLFNKIYAHKKGWVS